MAKLTYFLDDRGKTPSLKIGLAVNGKRVNIGLGIQIAREQWNGENVVGHPQAKTLNNFIHSRMANAQSVVYELTALGKISNMSAIEVKTAIMSRIDPSYRAEADKGLLSYQFEKYIAKTNAENTARLYRITERKLIEFCKTINKDYERLRIDDINYQFIEDLELWLKKDKGLQQNSVAILLADFRAVCNHAYLTDAATRNPFKNYPIKIQKTIHRVMPVEDLRNYFAFVPSSEKNKEYHDLAKLMFMLIGINLVDLYRLGPNSITADGYIVYTRAKTSRPYRIKIEPEAMEIINRYRGETHLLRMCDVQTEQQFKINFNSHLRRLGPSTAQPIFSQISSYWLRHSWATIASSLDIPFDIIARSLGHSWARVTETYVLFDNNKIDQANRKVLDWVFYGKKEQ